MTTTHYKQRQHEEAVARVRAQTTLIETWREAVARRDRLAAEYVEACELVADCAVDLQAATEASAGAIAEVLGVSKGTVHHQLRAGRALRAGDPVPPRPRGGRSEREKRAARRRQAQERPQVVPAPEGFEESLEAFREARRTGGQPAAEALLRERGGLDELIGPAEEVRSDG